MAFVVSIPSRDKKISYGKKDVISIKIGSKKNILRLKPTACNGICAAIESDIEGIAKGDTGSLLRAG